VATGAMSLEIRGAVEEQHTAWKSPLRRYHRSRHLSRWFPIVLMAP